MARSWWMRWIFAAGIVPALLNCGDSTGPGSGQGPGSQQVPQTAPDTLPPVVVRTEPAPGKLDVPLNTRVIVEFSEPLDPASVTADAIRLARDTVAVPGAIVLSPDGRSLTQVPGGLLLAGEQYRVTLSTDLRDHEGNALGAAAAITFRTTAVRPPPPPAAPVGVTVWRRIAPTYEDSSRFLLATDGQFRLQYFGTPVFAFVEYTGRYQAAGDQVTFDWDGWSTAGPWEATGVLAGDTLSVAYNIVMQLSDFEDGDYLLVRDDPSAPPATAFARTIERNGVVTRWEVALEPLNRFRLTVDSGAAGVRTYAGWYDTAPEPLLGTDAPPRIGGESEAVLLRFSEPIAGGTGYAYLHTLGPGHRALTINHRLYLARFEEGLFADAVAPANDPGPAGELAIMRDGQILLVRTDGTVLEPLTAGPRDGEPAWSPDGERLAFTRGGEGVMVLDLASGATALVAPGAAQPSWAPDGQALVVTTSADNGDQHLRHVDLSTIPATVTTLLARTGWTASPAWSPDGTSIAFESDWGMFDFAFDLYLLRPMDGSAAPLPAPLHQTQPAWAPDGRLATLSCPWSFVVCSAGRLEVRHPASGDARTVAYTEGYARPTWSPDGQAIAYGSAGSIHWVSADGLQGGLLIPDGHSPAWRP